MTRTAPHRTAPHRTAPHRIQPCFESLESRIQLSSTSLAIEYPVDFMGPLVEGATRAVEIRPMEYATGVRIEDATPALGNAISAILVVNDLGPDIIESTVWSYTISYGGYITDQMASQSSTNTTALIHVTEPGTYLVKAVTTYTSTNPSAPPHAPTTFTATANVSPPTTAIPFGGYGTPLFLNTATIVLSDINSVNGRIGVYASGWMQEWIPVFLDFNGVAHPFQAGWWPPGGSVGTFILTNGELRDTVRIGYDLVGGVGVDWSTIPDGSTVVTYVQQLQYAWRMTVLLPDGTSSVQVFTSPLNSLSWEMVKVSSMSWMLQPA